MKILIASDHAGFELKEQIISYLKTLNYDIEDLGPRRFDPEDDYPDYILPLAKKVAENPLEYKGLVFGGSGTGEAIVANRVSGVRAAIFYGGSTEIIRLSREHNDANILSLGARFLNEENAKQAVRLWLDTAFSNHPRHMRRIAKIDEKFTA